MQQYINSHQKRLRTDMDPKRQLKLLNDKFLDLIKQFMEQPSVPTNSQVSKQTFTPPGVVTPMHSVSHHPMTPRVQHVVQPIQSIHQPIVPHTLPTTPVMSNPYDAHVQQQSFPTTTMFIENEDDNEYETILSDDDEEWCTKLDDSYRMLIEQQSRSMDDDHLQHQTSLVKSVAVQETEPKRTEAPKEVEQEKMEHEPLDCQEETEKVEQESTKQVDQDIDSLPLLSL